MSTTEELLGRIQQMTPQERLHIWARALRLDVARKHFTEDEQRTYLALSQAGKVDELLALVMTVLERIA